MEVKNIVDLILYTAFTFGVIFVLIPLGLNFTYSSIKHINKHGIEKFENKAIYKMFCSKYPLEMLFIGLSSLFFSVWYLFIDQGGNIYMYYNETAKYFKNI